MFKNLSEYSDILKKVKLFNDIEAKELETMLNCIGYEIKKVSKGETVLLAGDMPKHIGIALSGQLILISD